MVLTKWLKFGIVFNSLIDSWRSPNYKTERNTRIRKKFSRRLKQKATNSSCDTAARGSERLTPWTELTTKSFELCWRCFSAYTHTLKKYFSKNYLTQDSIYYDPVLSALNEDLIEQYRFIRKTIDTGLPVMKNIQSLQREFEVEFLLFKFLLKLL